MTKLLVALHTSMDIAYIRKKLREAKAKASKGPPAIETLPGESPSEQDEHPAPVKDSLSSPVVETAGKEAPEEAAEKDPVPAMEEGMRPDVTDTQAKSVEEASGEAGEPPQERDGIVELLTFKLSGEEYAFRVSDVQEIITPIHIIFVPRTEPCVIGIISLRGKVVPVMDLKRRLFGTSNGVVSKILILKGPHGSIGVTVDKGMDVIRVPESSLSPPPAHLSEKETEFIEGVAFHRDSFVSIIRMDGLLNFNFKQPLEVR